MKSWSALASTTVLALGGLTFFAAPAHADLVTSCVGVGGAVTVPGELVVPAGKSCTLEGTTVEGKVTVRKGADLVVIDGTLKSNVTVQHNAFLDTKDTDIKGTVTTRGAYGAYLDESKAGKNVRTFEGRGTENESFLYTIDSSVGGNINATHGDVYLVGASVGGNIASKGTEYTDLYDTEVNGNLHVDGSRLGSVFCHGEVYGNASYTGNPGALQIGASGEDGTCHGVSYWGGDVEVKGNTGGVLINDNIIRGDLVGENNDPVAQKGANNRIRGEVTGEFADMPKFTTRSAPATDERADEIEGKASERRTEAKADAENAGKAF
ncbi:hypothetical protein CDO52_10020 [Nocardiopsis gilva YIM 90087]|uniref:Uncharacterized protein n=1 Tax=Nocardiopsis gilva YIM 90087 TaxID=1235441 RepID=A0A223S4L5_9ACTN|nr:hypothetical protein [Nocardiopsis gilva]ASU83072.1 hypothetical protein CDO52_10020 [Nocardiopsis gilva YIM 90087]